MKLEMVSVDFSRGVVALAEVYSAEVERLRAASAMMDEFLARPRAERDPAVLDELTDAARAKHPLWWRIAGIHPWMGNESLEERRAGIGRLLCAVEDMYRGELAARAASRSSDEAGSEERNPESPWFYDPLREICRYLQLPLSKLSELCLEQTGMRIHELGDAIRAKGFRGKMAEVLRPLLERWRETLKETQRSGLAANVEDSAWAFLKWVRGRGRAGNRKKRAWELGIPTAARLNKAVFVETGLTLEELELELAVELLEDLLTKPEAVSAEVRCAQSAGLEDVGDPVREEVRAGVGEGVLAGVA